MWTQVYAPVARSIAASAMVAAGPIFVLLYALGIRRMPSWKAAFLGLAVAEIVALLVYRMPLTLSIGAITYGAAFGLFPIGWVVFWAIVLYRITIETNQFGVIKESLGSLTADARLQALLIAFAFGAFVEGAAGFGTPVAVAAAMLTGLGFSPFYAAAICLLANTAPVAFGSIGIPLITLSATTNLPLRVLSAHVGRICAPVSLFIPAYLIRVTDGWAGLKGVLPAAATCGLAFAATQFLVSNFIGPQLTDILSAIAAMLALIALLQFWQPQVSQEQRMASVRPAIQRHRLSEIVRAWSPYGLLVIFVLLWGSDPVKRVLDGTAFRIAWPALHNLVERLPPVVAKNSPYPAIYVFNFASASGTACMMAALLSTLFLGMSPGRTFRLLLATGRQLLFPLTTIAVVLAIAFLMNYCGATATLGIAFAATGVLYPFFSAILGWLGVFLTGSDTSSNALFGNLQVITAGQLGLNPALMAAANSSGGVMGKMISLQSIAVATAATEMHVSEEGKLFRFTLRHSIFLASMIGLITLLYAYVLR